MYKRQPQGSSATNSSALATRRAWCTWSSLIPGAPRATFSVTLAENSTGSSNAVATTRRRSARRRSRTSTPSTVIRPPVTSASLGTSMVSVVLPEPVAPTRATVSPGRNSRSMPRSTSRSAPG